MSLKKITLLFFLAFVSPFIQAQDLPTIEKRTIEFTTTTAYVTVEGMACQEGCADAIAKNLEEIKGIQSAEVSFESGKAVINFDDAKIKIAEIEEVITNTKVKDYVYTVTNSVLKNKIVR